PHAGSAETPHATLHILDRGILRWNAVPDTCRTDPNSQQAFSDEATEQLGLSSKNHHLLRTSESAGESLVGKGLAPEGHIGAIGHFAGEQCPNRVAMPVLAENHRL